MRSASTIRAAVLSLCLTLPAQGAPGQTRDSVDAWTDIVRSGTLVEKVIAVSNLSQLPAGELPAATADVLIGELNRLNDELVRGADVQGSGELEGETLGEYYIDLAVLVASISSEAATLALVPAVEVSDGIQRRVAKNGDLTMPRLASLIADGYASGDMVMTMALAVFWADSTGAPLSDESRATFLQTLLSANSSTDYNLRRWTAEAYTLLADPALLPAAAALLQSADSDDDRLLAGALRFDVLPVLEAAAADVPREAMMADARSQLGLICLGSTSGLRRSTCQSLDEGFATVESLLASGQTLPARSKLVALAESLDEALDRGLITAGEHGLLAGGVRRMLGGLALPTVWAALVPVAGKSLKQNKGYFTVDFACQGGTVTEATLNGFLAGRGDVWTLALKSRKAGNGKEPDKGKKSKKGKKPGKSLKLDDVSFELTIVCENAFGTAVATASPLFAEKSKRDEQD